MEGERGGQGSNGVEGLMATTEQPGKMGMTGPVEHGVEVVNRQIKWGGGMIRAANGVEVGQPPD